MLTWNLPFLRISASRGQGAIAWPPRAEPAISSNRAAPRGSLHSRWLQGQQWPEQPGNTSSASTLLGLDLVVFSVPVWNSLCSVPSGVMLAGTMDVPAPSAASAWPWQSSAWGERSCAPATRPPSWSCAGEPCGIKPELSWPGWATRGGEGSWAGGPALGRVLWWRGAASALSECFLL